MQDSYKSSLLELNPILYLEQKIGYYQDYIAINKNEKQLVIDLKKKVVEFEQAISILKSANK